MAKSQRLKRKGSVICSLNARADVPTAPLQISVASLSTPSASFSGNAGCPPSGRLRSSRSSLWKNPTPAARSEDPSETLPASLRSTHPRRVASDRSEEHTSELQSRGHLVCRLLLEKK